MAYINNQVQAGVTRIMLISTHALRYKYMQPMSFRNSQMQAGATRINVDTYTCKQMQPMAYRNNQVQAGTTRIMWIPIHASVGNQWHIKTSRCKLEQLE